MPVMDTMPARGHAVILRLRGPMRSVLPFLSPPLTCSTTPRQISARGEARCAAKQGPPGIMGATRAVHDGSRAAGYYCTYSCKSGQLQFCLGSDSSYDLHRAVSGHLPDEAYFWRHPPFVSPPREPIQHRTLVILPWRTTKHLRAGASNSPLFSFRIRSLPVSLIDTVDGD